MDDLGVRPVPGNLHLRKSARFSNSQKWLGTKGWGMGRTWHYLEDHPTDRHRMQWLGWACNRQWLSMVGMYQYNMRTTIAQQTVRWVNFNFCQNQKWFGRSQSSHGLWYNAERPIEKAMPDMFENCILKNVDIYGIIRNLWLSMILDLYLLKKKNMYIPC